jgi:hypothetical protein
MMVARNLAFLATLQLNYLQQNAMRDYTSPSQHYPIHTRAYQMLAKCISGT